MGPWDSLFWVQRPGADSAASVCETETVSVDDRPRCRSPREAALLSRMCAKAQVEFTEWECARLLTEFKRNLSAAQWKALREDPKIVGPEDALQALIVFGFENRRLKRMRLRGRGRDRIWKEEGQKARLRSLMRDESRGVSKAGGTARAEPSRRGPGRAKAKRSTKPR